MIHPVAHKDVRDQKIFITLEAYTDLVNYYTRTVKELKRTDVEELPNYYIFLDAQLACLNYIAEITSLPLNTI